MKRILRKTVGSILGVALILLLVTLLSYSLMYLSPGDPAETILRAGGAMPSEADIIAKRHEMGLDQPFAVQYARWLGNFLRGDMGVSMVDGTNVSKELFKGLKASALLAVLSLGVGVIVAIPAGIYSAVKRNGIFDRITNFIVFLRLSMPAFLVGIGFLYLFAYKFRLFSVVSSGAGMKGVILPVATLSTGICCRMIRQIRTAVSDELKAPYVDGLRSRGLTDTKILFKHVLKNTMLPIVTLIALSFGSLLGGTAVTEIIFSYPGIGSMAISAINSRDYTKIQGYVVLIALIFCFIYYLTELSYSVFDPRLRKKDGKGAAV